jgi:carboxypeptidase Taq
VPPDDLVGALQDIHWTGGLGGFIGYTVGNVVSAQIWAAAGQAIGDLPERIAQGDFAPLLAFLRRELHQLGSRETTDGFLRKATGQGLTTRPYLAYIKGKFSELYGL